MWFNIGVQGVPQQASACFILAVDDTMDGILNWYREEGIIFKGGSGVRHQPVEHPVVVRAPRRRRHRERAGELHARRRRVGGHDQERAARPRRAAKMVILNVDHPDVEEFVWCKAQRGAQGAARCATPASTWTSTARDYHSIQYQNANNSVRVTDEFMQAVIDDARLDAQRRHDR